MSRGLHLLGYDWLKGSSAMTASLAEGLAEGATRTRAPSSAPPPPAPRPPPPPASNTVWYVGGAAVLVVVVALLLRSR